MFGNYALRILFIYLASVNLTYAACLSYKESITNNKNKKTINGFLLLPFTVMVRVGGFIYSALCKICRIGNKKEEDNFMSNCLSTFLMVMCAVGFYHVFILASNIPDDAGLFVKILSMVKDTIVNTLYYGLVYGLFGGECGRLRNTIVSKITDSVSNIAERFDKAILIEDFDSAKEVLLNEKNSIATTGKSSKVNVLDYVQSVFAKLITSIAEHIKGLFSLLSTGTGIMPYIMYVVIMFLIELLGNPFGETDMEEVSETVTGYGNIISDQIKVVAITFVFMILIRVLLKLILIVLPNNVSNAVYGVSNTMHDKEVSWITEFDKSQQQSGGSINDMFKRAEGKHNKKKK